MSVVPTSEVNARVRYINAEWRDKPETPRIGSRETRRAVTSFQEVAIRDARPRLADPSFEIDRCGFTLTENPTKASEFRDQEHVRSLYYEEVTEVVKRVSGADQVFVNSHLVRTEKPVDFNDGYARFVHCDYNMARCTDMAHEVLEKYGVEPQPQWTFAWYNTWQPFDHAVEQNPLAMIDWESLPMGDVIDYFYTGRGRDSLVAAPVYNPAHQFYYFSHMTTDEILVIKQLDARDGRSVYCPHTSFDDPTASDAALPRRSIESRLVAVFENA